MRGFVNSIFIINNVESGWWMGTLKYLVESRNRFEIGKQKYNIVILDYNYLSLREKKHVKSFPYSVIQTSGN